MPRPYGNLRHNWKPTKPNHRLKTNPLTCGRRRVTVAEDEGEARAGSGPVPPARSARATRATRSHPSHGDGRALSRLSFIHSSLPPSLPSLIGASPPPPTIIICLVYCYNIGSLLCKDKSLYTNLVVSPIFFLTLAKNVISILITIHPYRYMFWGCFCPLGWYYYYFPLLCKDNSHDPNLVSCPNFLDYCDIFVKSIVSPWVYVFGVFRGLLDPHWCLPLAGMINYYYYYWNWIWKNSMCCCNESLIRACGVDVRFACVSSNATGGTKVLTA